MRDYERYKSSNNKMMRFYSDIPLTIYTWTKMILIIIKLCWLLLLISYILQMIIYLRLLRML